MNLPLIKSMSALLIANTDPETVATGRAILALPSLKAATLAALRELEQVRPMGPAVRLLRSALTLAGWLP